MCEVFAFNSIIMEAKELRKGNYFTDKTESIFKLKRIEFEEYDSDDDFTLVYGISINGEYLWHEEAEPIPLTEEWLLKFGFYRGFGGEPKVEINKNISLSYNEGEIFIGDDIVLNHIKYIHQLQNLYFTLTGKELTFSL